MVTTLAPQRISVTLPGEAATFLRRRAERQKMSVPKTLVSIIVNMMEEEPKKREIGFLEGKAKVIFHDDWKMTPEELGMV